MFLHLSVSHSVHSLPLGLEVGSDQILFHSRIYDFDTCTCGATF